MCDQRADDGFLCPEARVGSARRRLAQDQVKHAADDVLVGRFRPIRDRALVACWRHFDLFRQYVMLLLQHLKLASAVFQLCLQCLPFHQHRLPRFQRDDGVSDALAAAEEKGWSLFRVVVPHPTLEIQMPDGEVGGVPERLVVQCDAIAAVWEFAVEDGIVDALGA